jgi:hypothetical protein
MSGVKAFFEAVGVEPEGGVSKGRLDQLEETLEVKLPADFRELYGLADGLAVDGGSMEFLDVERIEDYAGAFSAAFGYVAFAECNDSNPYALCCNGPLRGVVAHLYHDDESKLVCRDLGRFLDLVAERAARIRAAAGSEDEDEVSEANRLDDIGGDLAFAVRERTAEDLRRARELVRLSSPPAPDRPQHNEALRYAAQLFGEGQEDELAALFEADEYVRGAALERLRHLGTPRAAQVIAASEADLTRFVDRMVAVLLGAGMQVRREGNQVNVNPGNIHLNVPMWYSARRQADVFDDLLARVRRWQSQRR